MKKHVGFDPGNDEGSRISVAVGGERLEGTFQEHERRLLLRLGAESLRPEPDTALISLLSQAVLAAREHTHFVGRFLELNGGFVSKPRHAPAEFGDREREKWEPDIRYGTSGVVVLRAQEACAHDLGHRLTSNHRRMYCGDCDVDFVLWRRA